MVNICILTGGSNIYEPLVSKIKNGETKSGKEGLSELRFLNSNCTMADVDALACDEPFFSEKFIVEFITDNMDLRELRTILKALKALDKCIFIFINNRKDRHDACLEIFNDHNTKEINCYSPPYELFELYIKTYGSKKYTIRALHTMYKLMKRQWKLIGDYLISLESLDVGVIDIKEVELAIAKVQRINFDDLLISIITRHKAGMNIRLLYDYKYGYKFVMKTLNERMNLVLKLKADYINGVVSLNNLHEYAKEEKLPSFLVEKYMSKILTKYSTEELYYYKNLIRKYRNMPDGALLLMMEVM